MTEVDLVAHLLLGQGEPVMGADLQDNELLLLGQNSFSTRAFVIVRDWILLDLLVCEAASHELTSRGLEATVLYARSVVFDSRTEGARLGAIRSSYQKHSDGFYFESLDTLYILAGKGVRKHTSVAAVQALDSFDQNTGQLPAW